MSAIKLSTPSSGSISLSPANTASNLTITVPAVTGTMATLTTPSFATTIGVGGATPAASGAGITFPATQSASSDANTLDDYEEGTFTPAINGTGGAPTVTYVTANTWGYYTKVGRVVNFALEVRTSSRSGGSGDLQITGLPFAVGNISDIAFESAVSLYNISFNTSALYTAECYQNQTFFYIRGSVSNTSSSNLSVTDWSNATPTLIRITGSYFTL